MAKAPSPRTEWPRRRFRPGRAAAGWRPAGAARPPDDLAGGRRRGYSRRMNAAPAQDDAAALLAALSWQIEMGADECVADAPIDRFAASAETRAATKRTPPPVAPPSPPPPQAASGGADAAISEARRSAAAAGTLAELERALAAFEGCALKLGARNTVFADGDPAARVMFIGEAPGREEDRQGKPFVGRSGQLLDRMLAAIGLDRRSSDPASAAYIANIVPWRPVGNRAPSTDEAEMLWAFLERHIALAEPEIIVALGKTPAATMLERPVAITKMRGRWLRPARAGGRPLLLTLHPAYLLRQPAEKAKSWRDLLSLRAVLDGAAAPD
ncbi:uracil-DNA glycosylase [Paludibacillus litoralis]|uniref:uracil-DNA glycosylase n=1 Tax=Paludibacillus litoralis TaxID=3133267 RepID=UPI0039B77E96